MRHSVVILGPTASGKSDVAMAVAEQWGATEIVAVDSMQVYRGMDIGTAKPSADDRRVVAHHGLDLVDPAEEFTVAQFAAAATQARTGIAERGHHELLVAGTGLYLRALTDPMEMPGQWPAERAELELRAATSGVAALYAELLERDPRAAAKIEPGNVRRIVRALEVTRGSGRPFSSFGPGLGHYPPLPTKLFGLRWERDALRRRIAQRAQAMLDAGWRDEVRALLAAGPLSRSAAQALGYRELIEVEQGRASIEDALEAITQRTQQFAVRQERWFRRDPRITWIPIAADPVDEAATRIASLGVLEGGAQR